MAIHAMRGSENDRQLALSMIALRTLSTMYSIANAIRNIFQTLAEKRRVRVQGEAQTHRDVLLGTGVSKGQPCNVSDILNTQRKDLTGLPTASDTMTMPAWWPAPVHTPNSTPGISTATEVSSNISARQNDIGELSDSCYGSSMQTDFPDLSSIIHPSMMDLAGLAAFEFDPVDTLDDALTFD